jgi:hypothetical protein
LLLGEEIPVDRLEKRMLLEFGGASFGSQSVLRVTVQQTLDELLAVVADNCSRQ